MLLREGVAKSLSLVAALMLHPTCGSGHPGTPLVVSNYGNELAKASAPDLGQGDVLFGASGNLLLPWPARLIGDAGVRAARQMTADSPTVPVEPHLDWTWWINSSVPAFLYPLRYVEPRSMPAQRDAYEQRALVRTAPAKSRLDQDCCTYCQNPRDASTACRKTCSRACEQQRLCAGVGTSMYAKFCGERCSRLASQSLLRVRPDARSDDVRIVGLAVAATDSLEQELSGEPAKIAGQTFFDQPVRQCADTCSNEVQKKCMQFTCRDFGCRVDACFILAPLLCGL